MPMNEQSMGLFTDVVLEYKENDGPWERMKCHKAVLSSKSEYFRALFETEPSDLEPGHAMYELMDWSYPGDEVEAAIEFMYTSEYTKKEDDTWEDHLNRASIAEHFKLPDMEKKALTAFEKSFENNSLEQIAEKMHRSSEHGYKSRRFDDIFWDLRKKYREQIAARPDLTRKSDDKVCMRMCLDNIMNHNDHAMHVQCKTCDKRGVLLVKDYGGCGRDGTKQHKWSTGDFVMTEN